MQKKHLFISWSGDLSKNIAEILKLFFEETMQSIVPFFSPDIQKGSLWLEAINKSIENSSGGIICLTKENHLKPWVLFESGALSRVGKVCPIAFDMKKEDIKAPLNIFQTSAFNKKEFKKLFEDLNESMNVGLSQKVLDRYFEPNCSYDRLEKSINCTLEKHIYPSNIDQDHTLSLLLNLDEKVNKLISVDGRDSESDKKYLCNQLENIQFLLDNLERPILKTVKNQIQDILISVDYFISTLGKSDPETEKKLEKLNTVINLL